MENQQTYDYSTLQNTMNDNCDVHCLCRNNSERSIKDIAYYNYFVLNKPWVLSPPPTFKDCNKNNNNNK